MSATIDRTTKNRLSNIGKVVGPAFWILDDDAKDLWFESGSGVAEPVQGVISKVITGDGTTTSFTIGTIPKDSFVESVNISVITGGTAATTIAVGRAGSTGAYMAATSFSSAMDTAGVKTTTSVKVHEVTARTVLATFSAGWDAASRLVVLVRYVKLPPVS